MAHGRIYNIAVSGVAATVAQDLFEVVSASTGVTILRALEIAQSTEAGDAADEMLQVQIITGYTTSGSGGSSATPVPRSLGMSAYGGTAEINNTTVATTGTAAIHRASAFNVRGGYVWLPAEEDMIVVRPSERAVVRLAGTPADSITFWATLTIEEIS